MTKIQNKPQILGSLEESIQEWLEKLAGSGDWDSIISSYVGDETAEYMAIAAWSVLMAIENSYRYAIDEGAIKNT